MPRCAQSDAQRGASILSFKKIFVEEDSAHTQGAEDVQEEWTKALTEVMVTNKQKPMAAEGGCPEPSCAVL